MNFTLTTLIAFMLFIALLACTPLLLISPLLIRFFSTKSKKENFLFKFFETPAIVITSILFICLNVYEQNIFHVFLYLLPYSLLMLLSLALNKTTLSEDKRVVAFPWIIFVLIFLFQLDNFLKQKWEADYYIAVTEALQAGDKNKLNSLWGTCPEDDVLSTTFSRMSDDPTYPGASFEKIIECGFLDNNTYEIKGSFESALNINLLDILYKKMTPDDRNLFSMDENFIISRIDALKQCSGRKECSQNKVEAIDYLRKRFPEWNQHITFSRADLHRAIMLANKISVKFMLEFVQPDKFSDKLGIAILNNDTSFIIKNLKRKEDLLLSLGKKFNFEKDDTLVLDYILENGSEEVINYIINRLHADIDCDKHEIKIYHNQEISDEFKEKLTKKVCK
ncbi:hypothetical protein [Kalamiella sp. sgz302252]|uniref:hypothetical protein n=1 Tax=Pantoea sp. sgz302252 TaxID=3341827 RepID=UPI0036D30AA9